VNDSNHHIPQVYIKLNKIPSFFSQKKAKKIQQSLFNPGKTLVSEQEIC